MFITHLQCVLVLLQVKVVSDDLRCFNALLFHGNRRTTEKETKHCFISQQWRMFYALIIKKAKGKPTNLLQEKVIRLQFLSRNKVIISTFVFRCSGGWGARINKRKWKRAASRGTLTVSMRPVFIRWKCLLKFTILLSNENVIKSNGKPQSWLEPFWLCCWLWCLAGNLICIQKRMEFFENVVTLENQVKDFSGNL